ncbi:MAG: PKD domain-containing protein, partial [Candidatus Aminicenantes bacterium]|nr:PKD domain-containing protein [Candidatus Aminicenantes bacterium]
LDRAHIVCTPEIVTATRQVYYMWGTISGFSRAEPISGIENIHYPFLAEEGGNIYVCWQAGSYGDGIGVFYNIRREGKWEGEKVFPDTLGATYCDVVVAQDGSALYVTWDAGREIFVSSLTLPITNRPPVADFTFSPQRGEIPLTVTFDASPSYDPDGTIVSYHWTFGDGGSGTGKIVNYTYRSEGKFSVTLTVTDDKGKKATATKVVETVHVVYPPNNPTVSITISGLRKEPSANYRLSWAANPKNADELVKEYRIYRKEGDGEFKLFSIVGKTTTSVEYSFPPTKRLMWGITTFSTLNKESSMIIFK